MATFNRITVLAGAIALACSAWAQQPSEQYQPQLQDASYQDASYQNQDSSTQVDPPSRVARMAYLSGEVSFAPAGESDWSRAQRNRPMATGDKLYTSNGRAELQIGTSSILVDERSNMDFLTLNDQMTQVELTQGSLSLDIRRLRAGETYEVDTPTIAFVADRPGSYRIDVDADGRSTTVSARRGSGDAIGEGGNRVRIEEGQSLVFNDSQLSDYKIAGQRSNDNFDSYVSERVVRYERAPARQYVSDEVVGYEDLDDNGTWEDAPDYGHVWYPTHVAADWAPYHDGTWDWVEPYGWTWVDNSSWGFAPFHYGRWAYVGSRWGWVPGPVDVRPVYAPALVAFVGGGGFGVDISIGGPIGWFALGPGDVYFPSYPCGRGYFNSVNISNTVVNNTVVNNYYGAFSAGNVNYAQLNYRNRMAPRAMTAMPAAAFASGRPVATSAIAVNRTMLSNARVLPRATVAPTAASLVANRGRAMAPPARVTSRTVIAANRPAAAPLPFAQRQALLRQHPGQPLTVAQARTVAARTNVRSPAVTRSNVRVAGTAGAAATATTANARANPRATANAQSMSTKRVAPQPAAGATERSAQMRSSGFAHQGNAPGNQRNVQSKERQQAQAKAHANAPVAATTNTRGQAQLQSSRYAQQQKTHGNAANAQANTRIEQQRNKASARVESSRGNATVSSKIEQRGNAKASVRSSSYASQNRAAEPRIPPASTRANEHAQTRMSQQAQTQINTPRPAEHLQAQTRASAAARASEQERVQARVQQQNRANDQRVQAQSRAAQVRANEQQRAQAHVQQPTRVTEQRAPAQSRAPEVRANEQQRAQAHVQQPARVNAPPRAQAQYREPARPTSQRQPAPQREAKRKDEKRDQNGGG